MPVDTHTTEEPPRHLGLIVFGQALDQMGQNYAHSWPKMPVLGQIWPFLGLKSIFSGEGLKLHIREPMSGQNMVISQVVNVFFGPKISIHFPHWKQFFEFPFPS